MELRQSPQEMIIESSHQSFDIKNFSHLVIRQHHEVGEWIGFETRNKYEIRDEKGLPIGFAAEQQKGIFGFLIRQFLGHWRSFEIRIFNAARIPVLIAKHPFRFFFQRLEVFEANGQFVGVIQQRFSILTKRFDVQNEHGQVVMEVSSPFWRIWTFPFKFQGRELASIQKKWAGALSEIFTDKDNFHVGYTSPELTNEERWLVLAAAIFVDLQYFENKARNHWT